MAILIIGFKFSWGRFILLAFLSSALFTLIGLSVTVFFKDMSSWFSVSVLVLAVNMLTMVSYSYPAFSPAWIKVIPSYPIIFALEGLLFGMHREIGSTLLTILFEAAVLFILTCFLVKKKLLQSERRIL
jgi:ABC-2 type transport system permease protein/fluoroquinolone transport system permease protein